MNYQKNNGITHYFLFTFLVVFLAAGFFATFLVSTFFGSSFFSSLTSFTGDFLFLVATIINANNTAIATINIIVVELNPFKKEAITNKSAINNTKKYLYKRFRYGIS